MWAIVFAVTAVGPAAMVALRRVIEGPPASEEERTRKAAQAEAAALRRGGAPPESPAAAYAGDAAPVELAEAFLHGEFDEFGDDADDADRAAAAWTTRDGDGDAAAGTRAPGTLRGGDPRNPFGP